MWNLEGLSKDNVDESENVILLEDVTSRFCNDFYSKSFSELNTKQLSSNENNCDKHKKAKGTCKVCKTTVFVVKYANL